MEIRKKPKEQTQIELRNTSIINFLLIALVPVILCLLLGFSMGQVEDVNAKKLKAEIAELRNENKQLNEDISTFSKVFEQIDTVFSGFKQRDVARIEKNLGNLEDEFAVRKWKKEVEEAIDDFNRRLRNVEKTNDKWNAVTDKKLKKAVTIGNKWIEEYTKTKDDELYAMRVTKKNEMGAEICSDLQERITDLSNQLTEKNTLITVLQGSLQRCEDNSQNTVQSKEDYKGQYDALKTQNVTIMEAIVEELATVREEILPDLKPKKLLAQNRQQITAFKEKMNAKLNAIQMQANRLE